MDWMSAQKGHIGPVHEKDVAFEKNVRFAPNVPDKLPPKEAAGNETDISPGAGKSPEVVQVAPMGRNGPLTNIGWNGQSVPMDHSGQIA